MRSPTPQAADVLDEMRGQLAGDAARALCRVLPHVAGPSHAHVLVRRALGGGGEGEDGGGDDDGDGGGGGGGGG